MVHHRLTKEHNRYYAEGTGMPGAADVYLYPKETIKLPHVDVLLQNMDRCVFTDVAKEFASFYKFRQSFTLPKKVKSKDISAMMMKKHE